MNDVEVRLLRFGAKKMNITVKGHPSNGFWYVWLMGAYHGVSESDIEVIKHK